MNGRFDEALGYYDAADILDPNDDLGFLTSNRLRTYLWAGRWTEAREHFLGRPGPDEARRERIARLWEPGLPPPAEVARDVTEAGGPAALHFWLAAGDVERAYAIFEPDFLANSFGQRSLLWSPDLLEVRDDPRYREALRRSNLEGRTVRIAPPE
jgi:tetratricopeptide (TPR) repeat protein